MPDLDPNLCSHGVSLERWCDACDEGTFTGKDPDGPYMQDRATGEWKPATPLRLPWTIRAWQRIVDWVGNRG